MRILTAEKGKKLIEMGYNDMTPQEKAEAEEKMWEEQQQDFLKLSSEDRQILQIIDWMN